MMQHGPRAGLAVFVLVLLFAAASGHAQMVGAGSDEPIEIEADVLEVRQNQGIATFRGNVDAVQGDMTLTSDVLDVFYTSADRDGQAE
ncbi:MAG: LptA/OstA family protein, partial [Pseudomonadota bacterium]